VASAKHIGRRTIAGAALAGLATLVTACGTASPAATSGSHATSSTAASKTTTTTTTTTSSATTTSPATPPTRSTPASAPTGCLSRYLHAAPGASQGTAGSVYVAIVFTNLNNQACTLYGYPGVSLASGVPVKQVGLAATENPTPPRELVTLRPHGTASALLRIVDAGNYSTAQCGPVTTSWLQVYPPNQTVPLYLHYSSNACAKPVHLLSVNVVQPGSGS
jgi:Protein of unknown function (DUF4232)